MAPSSRSAAPVAPTRAPVRSVGSGAALPLSFDVRTAFDFALSLATEVGEQDELPAEDRAWLVRCPHLAARRGRPRDRRRAVHLRRRAARGPPGRHGRCRLRRRCCVRPAGRSSPASCSRTTCATRGSATTWRRPTTAIARRPSASSRAGPSRSIHGWPACSATRTRSSPPSRTAWRPGCRATRRSSRACAAIIERDVALRADRARDARPRRPDRAHHQRHPLAVRAGRAARGAGPVLPRPSLQLHVHRR